MDTWALDYFDNILIPMDNFVTRSPERFVSCKDPDYLYQAYYICKKCLEEKGAHMTEMEKLPAPKLMEIILTSCRGRVDQWVEPFILLALQHVEACETNLFKDLLMKVVAGAFYYNAPLAVAGLQKAGPGALGKFFQLWFAMLWRKSKRTEKNLHFKRDHDKKLCILGLSTLLAVPPQSLPPELRDAGKQLMEANLKLLFDLKQLRDNAEDSSSEDESEEGSDYEEEDDDEPGAESHKMYGGVGAIESIFGLRGGGTGRKATARTSGPTTRNSPAPSTARMLSLHLRTVFCTCRRQTLRGWEPSLGRWPRTSSSPSGSSWSTLRSGASPWPKSSQKRSKVPRPRPNLNAPPPH